jgi:hypothetical protein
MSKSLTSHPRTWSSGWSSLCASSRRNLATSMDRSKERGSISPVQEGTVGLRPEADLTKTRMPFARTNSYDLPPRTNTSLVDSRSTNFSERSPMNAPRSLTTL